MEMGSVIVEKGKKVLTMRLIDADALQRVLLPITFAFEREYGSLGGAVSGCMKHIDNAPTVDAVEVVRCRECKQGEIDDPDFPDQYYCHAGCGWNNGGFYCAYGERKEGDGND